MEKRLDTLEGQIKAVMQHLGVKLSPLVEDLDFSQALYWLKQGKKVSCWNTDKIYVYLREITTIETSQHRKELRVHAIDGYDYPWNPNNRELLDHEWRVVE